MCVRLVFMLIVNLAFRYLKKDQQFCHTFSTVENMSYSNMCNNMFESLRFGYFSTILLLIFQ